MSLKLLLHPQKHFFAIFVCFLSFTEENCLHLVCYAAVSLLQLLWVLHRVSEKNGQNCFCHNFVKFLLNLIIFGMKMAKMMKLCKMHSLSTSPNLCQRTTMWNRYYKLLHNAELFSKKTW